MKYAQVDNQRNLATKGAKGACPLCGSEVIAKCGERKINHWAHKGARSCDPWWEPETLWHRAWKNKFPVEWQENALFDEQTGEKHIADVLTSQRLVLEFQHSHIHPDERKSRENFYKNLVWVVDGTRLKYDYPRFQKGKASFRSIKEGIFEVNDPEENFPKAWLNSSVPVIFDFLGDETIIEHSDAQRKFLYCLYPVIIGMSVYIEEIPRNAFVKSILEGEWLEKTQEFVSILNQTKLHLEELRRKEEIKKANQNLKMIRTKNYWPRRIF